MSISFCVHEDWRREVRGPRHEQEGLCSDRIGFSAKDSGEVCRSTYTMRPPRGLVKGERWKKSCTPKPITGEKSPFQCAGMNRPEAENERVSRERSSDPLGLESCVATARNPTKRR